MPAPQVAGFSRRGARIPHLQVRELQAESGMDVRGQTTDSLTSLVALSGTPLGRREPHECPQRQSMSPPVMSLHPDGARLLDPGSLGRMIGLFHPFQPKGGHGWHDASAYQVQVHAPQPRLIDTCTLLERIVGT